MTIKTIFLDRDGVVNKEVNYLYKINDFKFIDGVFEACQHFKKLNYETIIVTNQSGIYRGYYKEEDFQKLSKWMLSQFIIKNIPILEVFHCPHSPVSNCSCRKPKPGMFNKAKELFNIDMEKSWMIGDKEEDITASNSAGIKNTILVRSGHEINESNSKSKFIVDSIKEVKKIIVV
jgi:D-glycero-D-manno-heptose 1,7-bisphosphate phosphatase